MFLSGFSKKGGQFPKKLRSRLLTLIKIYKKQVVIVFFGRLGAVV